MAAADDVDSAPCNDMEQSKVKTQLESTSEITHIIVYIYIYSDEQLLRTYFGKCSSELLGRSKCYF